MYGTSDQEGSTGTIRANHDIQVRFQDWRRGRPAGRISGTGEDDTMRRTVNCGKYGHKEADCWYKQTTKSQGKDKDAGKSKSKVTEISASDSSKQVDET